MALAIRRIGRRGNWVVESSILFMINIFIIMVILIGFVAVTQYYVADIYKIPSGLERFLIERRFFTPLCFGTEDEASGRSQGIIGWGAFEQKNLDRCYIIPDKDFIAYELVLSSGEDKKSVASPNWDADKVPSVERRFPVVVMKDGYYSNGLMLIKVQNEK